MTIPSKNKHRGLKSLVAVMAAVATLLTGGLVAGTAMAGDGGGTGSGGGGGTSDGAGNTVHWVTKDSWAATRAGVEGVLNEMGHPSPGSAYANQIIDEALSEAISECEASFNGEGSPDCRLVAVGFMTSDAGDKAWDPYASTLGDAGKNAWKTEWAKEVKNKKYIHNGTTWTAVTTWTDKKGTRSVTSMANADIDGNIGASLRVIVLAKDQPVPSLYDLNIYTQASDKITKAGDTNDVSDQITLTRTGSDRVEDVSGTITLHWRGVDGSVRTKDKSFTAKNNGSKTVSFSYRDADATWESWPAGKFWFDVNVPKQAHMKADSNHAGENDARESWDTPNTPPSKVIVNAAGKEIKSPNDQLAANSLYTAKIKAHSSASQQFWIYDIIDVTSQKVTLGAVDADDFSKIHVVNSANEIVAADISVDDSQAGKRIVKAHVTNPTAGWYTLMVPQASTPTGSDYTILDDSKACWQGDNNDCQTGDSKEVGKVTPKPDKVWVLDKNGALHSEDPTWTNSVAADKKTFVPGDTIGAVVNGRIPAHLLNPLTSYSITDDWTPSAKYIDWSDKNQVTVYVDGQDRTSDFNITVDTANHTTTATAKAGFLLTTAFKNTDSKVKLYVGGTIKLLPKADQHITVTNKASETWNGERKPTNEPPVYIRTPNPNKVWSKDEADAKQADDPDKTNKVSADTKTFVRGDTVSVTVNGKLPANLAKDLSSYEIGDDWSKDASKVDLSDVKSVKVYVDGKDRTSGFDVHTEGNRTWVTAKAETLKGTGGMGGDRKVRMTIDGKLKSEAVQAGQTITIVNDGWEKWNQQSIPTNEPPVKEWAPNPDKSWIRFVDGKWETVIDPDETNKTGIDTKKVLDGDVIGSAVNGTLASNLAKLEKFSLTDDWTNSDYLFDPDQASMRVYEQTVDTDQKSSVANIANTGKDVTDQFTIAVNGSTATATASQAWLDAHVGLDKPVQVTFVAAGKANFANGGGGAQVREDFGKEPGDEVTFCTAPKSQNDGKDLTNKGIESVNNTTENTNEPQICGYVPPVEKKVIAEGSEGGDQDDANKTTVFPGQKLEYQLTTKPQLPKDLAYSITHVAVTDVYDEHFTPDVQTVEVIDLNTGDMVGKSKYATSWDSDNHSFTLTFNDEWVAKNWPNGSNPRIQVRFEGTVDKDAPTDQLVDNEWKLTLNNSISPSNKVENNPPRTSPTKEDTQKDPSINIDGKTALLGDQLYYRINVNAKNLTNTTYKVWRLGMVDDYDDEYLTLNEDGIEILDDNGQDVTDRFNIQAKDGVVYAFAKTVDTYIDATGLTAHGDPQPSDLKAYSELTDKDYDPLADPAIDQTLLGHTYQVVLPMTVTKVKDGYVVKNTATQITNDKRDVTNTVTNPVKEINPKKDVTASVDGESKDGHAIVNGNAFLYRLDSSILPANRAYPEVTDWSGVDKLDTEHDQYLDNWAVYAQRDLYKDGEVLAKAGDKLAGKTFDSDKYGDEPLFEVEAKDGVVTVKATQAYLDLVSADGDHEAGWSLYLQCRRIKSADRVENMWTETINGQERPSNTVVTHTPDMTPSLHLEKWDTESGFPAGDRDKKEEQLLMHSDSREITFTITNTSKTDPATGEGALFKTSDLKLDDSTLIGDAKIDLKALILPDDWGTRILKPGESVDVKAILSGVKEGSEHQDRAIVTGTPLVECPADITDPFEDETDNGGEENGGEENGDKPVDGENGENNTKKPNTIEIDGKQYCRQDTLASNTDDWYARRETLADTGIRYGIIGIMATGMLAAGVSLSMNGRKRYADMKR